jgi:hypothetical protein
MGAAGSINDDVVNTTLRGISAGQIAGLDTATLRPYLKKFLRMRKSGIPAGACYQAALHQIQGDNVDKKCLRPLEDYLHEHTLRKENVSEGKDTDDDESPYAEYFKQRSGPAAEELLEAFGMTEDELRSSMQTAKTNSHYGAAHEFLERYVGDTQEDALEQAIADGVAGKQLAWLKLHLESRAKYESSDHRAESKSTSMDCSIEYKTASTEHRADSKLIKHRSEC